jgi:hypothetical protein
MEPPSTRPGSRDSCRHIAAENPTYNLSTLDDVAEELRQLQAATKVYRALYKRLLRSGGSAARSGTSRAEAVCGAEVGPLVITGSGRDIIAPALGSHRT